MIFLNIDSNHKNTHFYRYKKEVTRFFCIPIFRVNPIPFAFPSLSSSSSNWLPKNRPPGPLCRLSRGGP